MRKTLSLLVIGLCIAAVAEAAKIKTKNDPSVDYSSFHTYRWKFPSGPTARDVDGPIRAAAVEELAKKGLRLAADGEEPDLLLEYNAGLADQLVAGVSATVGWYGEFFLYPEGASIITAGVLFLFTDPETSKPIWAGWLMQRGTNEDAAMVMRRSAPKFTRKVLSRYPN